MNCGKILEQEKRSQCAEEVTREGRGDSRARGHYPMMAALGSAPQETYFPAREQRRSCDLAWRLGVDEGDTGPPGDGGQFNIMSSLKQFLQSREGLSALGECKKVNTRIQQLN